MTTEEFNAAVNADMAARVRRAQRAYELAQAHEDCKSATIVLQALGEERGSVKRELTQRQAAIRYTNMLARRLMDKQEAA